MNNEGGQDNEAGQGPLNGQLINNVLPIGQMYNQRQPQPQIVQNEANDNGQMAINMIGSKVPFPSMQKVGQIELWFAQMQSWFELNRVTSDATKYNMVVANLRHDVLEQVEEIVRHPPAQDKFETIKAAIILRFADSERTRVHKLVSGITLGDKKPSTLLQELRRANVSNDETLLKTLWLARLPATAQTSISIAQGNLTEVAALADVVVETLRLNNVGFGINQIEHKSAEQIKDDRIDELMKMVAELRADRQVRGRSQSRSRNTGASRGRTPAREYEMCWYHFKFGANAKKCGLNNNPPKSCNFETKNS